MFNLNDWERVTESIDNRIYAKVLSVQHKSDSVSRCIPSKNSAGMIQVWLSLLCVKLKLQFLYRLTDDLTKGLSLLSSVSRMIATINVMASLKIIFEFVGDLTYLHHCDIPHRDPKSHFGTNSICGGYFSFEMVRVSPFEMKKCNPLSFWVIEKRFQAKHQYIFNGANWEEVLRSVISS
jgi:serine/threonine protein kinase